MPLSNEDTGAPPSNGGGLLLLAAVSGQIHNLDLRKRAEPLSAGPVHEVAVEEEVSASPVGPLSPSSSDVVLDSAPTSPRPASPDARALLTRSLSSSSASNSSSTSSAQSLVVPHADSCCSSNRHPQHHLQAASQPFPGIAARRPNILNPHLYNVANPDNDPHVLQGKSCGYTLLADKYVLFDKIEGSNNLHRCFEILSGRQKEFVCKVKSTRSHHFSHSLCCSQSGFAISSCPSLSSSSLSLFSKASSKATWLALFTPLWFLYLCM